MTYAALLASIDRRATELSRARDSLTVLDGARPISFLVDFFAARRVSSPALSHPPGIPEPMRALRDAAVRGASPSGDVTVFFSSGSVGSAKAVPLSEANLESAALSYAAWNEVAAGDRVAIGSSPGQIFGLVRGALNALLVGAEAVFFRPGRDPLAEAQRLGAGAVLLPSALLPLAARHGSRVRLRALRCGGGPISDAHAEVIEAARGVPVRAGYGLTETSGLGARQPGSLPRRAGSSGRIAPGMELRIVGEDGRECAPGELGEIRLRGAAVFAGYLSEASPDPFDEAGWLKTGDAGSLDRSGELCVRGRLAFALRSGDRILCAEEVEAAIAEHPGVFETAAAPWANAFGVLVVLRDPSDTLLQDVRAHARSRLPVFALPRRILSVPAIPSTPAGKVDRRAAARWLTEASPPA